MHTTTETMLVMNLKIIDLVHGYYIIEIKHGDKIAKIAFSPNRKNLIFLKTDKLSEILKRNEFQIRKLLHNKRKSTFYTGFEIKFVIKDNKKVQEFNEPGRIIVLDKRGMKYNTYTIDKPTEGLYTIYTDGCHLEKENIGSYVALLQGKSKLYDIVWGRLSGRLNSTLLELIAVIEALKKVPRSQRKIRIVTDSRYVIKGLTEWVINWKLNDWYTIQGTKVKNIAYWQEFDKLTENKYIEFQWIKGHSFHFENTICDKYAKEVAYSTKIKTKKIKP